MALPDGVDLAVVRLEPFDASHITAFPRIKDPAVELRPGTSLCRLGFPFHNIEHMWNPNRGFVLPAGAVPLPVFPIEGILTRQ